LSTWRIVGRREFVERARDRGFIVSTGITLAILVGFIVVASVLDRGTRFVLAPVGESSRPIADGTVAAAAAIDIEVRLLQVRDADEARRAVRDGDADAALLDGGAIVVRSDPPAQLVGIIQAVSQGLRSRAALLDAGLSRAEVEAMLEQAPLQVVSLEPRDARERENAAVAFVGVLALYGQLFAYGYWIASGVVEEKASRVIEVLIATVRPSELLRGKIFGIGLLGLAQLLTIGIVGLGTAVAVGSLDFPAGALTTVGIVLFWFMLGFFFYSGLFAVAGSIVARQEDLQTTMTPLTILIVGSFFVA